MVEIIGFEYIWKFFAGMVIIFCFLLVFFVVDE